MLRTLQAAGKQVTGVRWVPGRPLVAGASGDSKVKYWNPNGNGNVARTFDGPGDYVDSGWPRRRTARSSPPAGPTASCSSGTAMTVR